MRRSICHAEPHFVIAGEKSTIRFIYTLSSDLPKGTLLKFSLLSEERPIDWLLPSPSGKSNVILLELPKNKVQKAKAEDSSYLFQLPSPLKTGDTLTIVLDQTTPQTYIQRKRPFHLFIDPKGKGIFGEPEIFHIDVKGSLLKTIRIITPSIVSRNRRFDVLLRFEDSFGNLTSNAPDDTLIEVSYRHIRENLNWKLFVPETGFICLPNLYFNEPGVYRLELKNQKTKEAFFSPPIKCFLESDISLYWGNFHRESVRFDAMENIENYLRYMRDEKSLQFIALSPFESEKESEEGWKSLSHHITEMNEPDRFSAFLGFQWEGKAKEEGLRHFLYLKDNKPLMHQKDMKYNCLKKIYKTIPSKEMLSIPSFTMGSLPYDFKEYNSEYEKVVEIYNAWGSSECTVKEGNTRPISHKKIKEFSEGSVQKALQNNCRFGFVAGGLDDRGIYRDFYENAVQYSPGLTAIIAKDHTRDSIFEALKNRSCYATTGERIILGFNIAEKPMGSELTTQSKPGLAINRFISGFAIGTSSLSRIEIIRNGEILTTFHPKAEEFEFEYDDFTPLEKVILKSKNGEFVYYYLRVIQENGHMAWSSPIWIDTEEKKKKK